MSRTRSLAAETADADAKIVAGLLAILNGTTDTRPWWPTGATPSLTEHLRAKGER